jgi:FG-GAP-like repeat
MKQAVWIIFILINHMVVAQSNAQITFTEHILDNAFNRASGIFIADLDGDSDNDIVGAAINMDEVAWWRNEGGFPPVWMRLTVDDTFDGSIYVYVADVDGDDRNDVLATAAVGNELAWWRNDGSDPIGWTKEIISDSLLEAHGVHACDLDSDGDTDILGTTAGDNKVLWWEQVLSGQGERIWKEHIITDNFRYTQTLCPVDINGDNYLDVVGGALYSNEIAWFQNNGSQPIAWTKHVIDDAFRYAHCVDAKDLDGDEKPDVIGASYLDNEIAWWKNMGGDPVTWTKAVIGSGFRGALMVHAADLDDDNDPDVLGTANKDDAITWWRNDGGNPVAWKKHVIHDAYDGAWPIYTGDLDGDGDLDISTGADTANEITWWENSMKTMELGVDLVLPQEHFVPGDTFSLKALLSNPETAVSDVPLIVFLEVYGDFWFWPAWSMFDPAFGEGFDFAYVMLANGVETQIIIEPFTWPDTGPGTVSGIRFYGAMLTSNLSAIMGFYDVESWSFGGAE